MAFLFKQTHVFEQSGKGWTEVLYFERPTGDVQAAIDWTREYPDKRRVLLGAQGTFVGQRTVLIQDDTGAPVKNVGLNNFFQKPDGSPLTGTAAQPSEDTSTSLQVVWSDAQSRYKKNLFMCGAWQAIFPSDNIYKPAGAWTGFWNNWVGMCKQIGFGWRRRTVDKEWQITGYTTDNNTMVTTYTLTTAASLKATFNGQKRTVGVDIPTKRTALDGMQVVVWVSEVAPVAPATDWITTVKTAGPRPSLPFTVPGRMLLYKYTFVTPAASVPQGPEGSINAVRPVKHSRGRPLFQSRGRQPNRVRA